MKRSVFSRYFSNRARLNWQSPIVRGGAVLALVSTICGGGAIAIDRSIDRFEENLNIALNEAIDQQRQDFIQTYGSLPCARVRDDLATALTTAITGGNQSIIDGVVSKIAEYEDGQGEQAKGDQCEFPKIRESLVIYNLD